MTRHALAVVLALCVGCTTTTRYRVNDARGQRVEDPTCVSTGPASGNAARGAARAALVTGRAQAPTLGPDDRCEVETHVRVGTVVALVVAGGLLLWAGLAFGTCQREERDC